MCRKSIRFIIACGRSGPNRRPRAVDATTFNHFLHFYERCIELSCTEYFRLDFYILRSKNDLSVCRYGVQYTSFTLRIQLKEWSTQNFLLLFATLYNIVLQGAVIFSDEHYDICRFKLEKIAIFKVLLYYRFYLLHTIPQFPRDCYIGIFHTRRHVQKLVAKLLK